MIFDISPPITDKLKVWPGDTLPTREVLLDMHQGSNITLSTLRATVHLGAHADAPSHYGTDAPAIHERPLESLRQVGTHGRLPATHEADEHDIIQRRISCR